MTTLLRAAPVTAAMVLAPFLPAGLSAQAPPGPDVEIGERVRIDYVLEGTLVERDREVLIVRPDEAGPEGREAVPLSEINRLEAWRCCNRTSGFLRGAGLGIGAAVVTGLVLQSLPDRADRGANMAMAGTLLVGVPIGAVVGGLMGTSQLAPTDWVQVELRRD